MLLKKEGTTYIPYKNASLLDDGNQSNADLLQGDGIYSASLSLTELTQGLKTLVVGIEVNGQWKEASLPTSLISLENFTPVQAEEIIKQSTTVKEQIVELQQEGKTEEQIKTIVVQSLKESEEISHAGVSESGNLVWYALKSGVLGATSLSSNESLPSKSMKALGNQVVANAAAPTAVGNKKAIIFSAHGQTDGEKLAAQLMDSGFSVNYFKDDEANIEQFKKMFEYGTIVFDTLGAALFKGDFTEDFPYLSGLFNKQEEQVVVVTGEAVTENKLKNYNADLKTGRLVTVNGYFAITPAFIQYYGGKSQLPQSLVYANTPYSLYNDTLANQFLENKAQSYAGFEEERLAGAMQGTFNSLLQGTLLSGALSDQGKYIGNGSLAYTLTANLGNGSLEQGKEKWISGGHFEVITHLGVNQEEKWATLYPTDGKNMGIISSGVDDKALNGRQSWAYQTFVVPEDMNVLKFDYNVVSNEPMEFIGTRYDDTFKATLVEGTVKEPQETDEFYGDYPESIYDVKWLESTVDTNEKIIAYESINSSDWGYDYKDDRQRVDVEFSDGDRTTYMTEWKTLTFDVSEYKGKTVTLKLQTWDLGDTAYPTAVLFDRVHFAKSTVSGFGIDGFKEVFIPTYGEREYQYNTVLLDQFNEKITGELTTRLNKQGYRQPVMQQLGTFSLKNTLYGVSIDSTTGLLKVSSSAAEGEVTIVATGDKGTVEYTVPVKNLPTLNAAKLAAKVKKSYELFYDADTEQDFINQLLINKIQLSIENWEAEVDVSKINDGENKGKYLVSITINNETATVLTEVIPAELSYEHVEDPEKVTQNINVNEEHEVTQEKLNQQR